MAHADRARPRPDQPGAAASTRSCSRRTDVKALVPQIDLTGGGRYPVLGASHHVPAATARHDRVAWAFASRRDEPRRPRRPAPPGDGAAPRRRSGRRRRDGRRARSRPASSCRRPVAGSTPVAGDGRRPPAGPDAPAPRVRHERLRAGPRQDRRLDRARLLRLADRARPDADRRRVRQPAVVRADLVVRRAPELRLQDHEPAAVPARRCGSCGRGPGSATSRPTSARSWARPASPGFLDHDRLGDVGVQGDPGRRRGDGRADRDRPDAGAHRAVLAGPLRHATTSLADQASAGTR